MEMQHMVGLLDSLPCTPNIPISDLLHSLPISLAVVELRVKASWPLGSRGILDTVTRVVEDGL